MLHTLLSSQTNAVKRLELLHHRKKRFFQILYEFTNNQCGECSDTGCACKDRICQHVEEHALKRGHRFEHTGHTLRFIGKSGCVVPPHLRETCTIYLCEKAQKKPDFDKSKYEKLKRICARLDWQIMEIEDAFGLNVLYSKNDLV